MKNIEIIIYGRGGQGAKTCAQIIAESALIEGYNIQAFPEYGPERRGAPVRSFVRLSNKEIRSHNPITNPDLVIILDSGLFDVMEDLKNFKSIYLINTNKNKIDFKNIIKNTNEIYTIDGSKIALEEIKINNSNIVLIGSFIKIFNDIIKLNSVKKIIEKTFKKKNKEYLIKTNYNCLEKGYNNI
jgi:pyruvate ferredoxin oxidoreductase gamma subunit